MKPASTFSLKIPGVPMIEDGPVPKSAILYCHLCGEVFDSRDIRCGGYCSACGKPTCHACGPEHARKHYRPVFTAGGEIISKFSNAGKKTKSKTEHVSLQLNIPLE